MIYYCLEDKSQWGIMYVYVYVLYMYIYVYIYIYTHVQITGSQGVYIIILTVIVLNMVLGRVILLLYFICIVQFF